jgi:hypothetical protein
MQNRATKHIVLLGASIGKTWKIDELPLRVGDSRYSFEYAGQFSPDKSKKLTELLNREENRPDAIIIKECASFFPGDSQNMQDMIRTWVSMCRSADITPILATVVPVVKSYPLRVFVLSLLHGKFVWPSHTFDEIIVFNDWIRQYAMNEGLAVLDLESALRQNESNRHLKSKFTRRGGLHLNARAYRELDKIVIPTLMNTSWGELAETLDRFRG